MLAAMPAAAQSGYNPGYNGGSGWNRDAFWRGAPADPYQRIDFLQRRIERGVADGSLSRREARQYQADLDRIRGKVRGLRGRHGGRLTGQDNAYIQARLDGVSQQIRWHRQDTATGYSSGTYGAGGYGAGRQGDWDRRYATDYDAASHYRDGSYAERRLGASDEVYRGSDGRYYCKRNDGTTGLVVGAAAGGILGNVVDGGHNRVAGTLIGGALGALAGKSIDQNSDIRCR
jgi:hypothetical protein